MSLKKLMVLTLSCMYYFNAQAMQQLQKWKDAAPFAGHVVAYVTDEIDPNDYFGSPDNRFLNKIAYVQAKPIRWMDGTQSYYLRKLMPYSEAISTINNALTDPLLKGSCFEMRHITPQEKTMILKALKNKHAEFSKAYSKDVADTNESIILSLIDIQ